MRISDWSSDVCSSDLQAKAGSTHRVGHRLDIGKAGGAHADRDVIEVWPERECAGRFAGNTGHGGECRARQRWPVAAHQAFDEVFDERIGIRLVEYAACFEAFDMADEVTMIDGRRLRCAIAERSEEHTSELQSLMR